MFNLGSGRGYTVREAAAAVGDAAGRRLTLVERPRRPGDIGALVADIGQAKAVLGWTPLLGLTEIANSALAWERRHLEERLPRRSPAI